jgi:hypothetical protein
MALIWFRIMNHGDEQTEFLRTNRIYDCAVRASTIRTWVSFPELEHLIERFRLFKLELGEDSDVDYWALFNWRVRHYEFMLSTLPLSPNHPSLESVEVLARLNDRLAGCGHSYPAHAARAADVVRAFEAVAQQGSAPLLDAIIGQTIENADSTVLVINEGRLVDVVQQVLCSNVATNRMRAMSPKEITASDCLRHLVVFGARRWYPEYLFTAPRAEHVHLICYDWIRDRWSPQNVLLGTKSLDSRTNLASSAKGDMTIGTVDPDELIAEIDLARFAFRFVHHRGESSEAEEANALLLALEGDTAVFVESSEGSEIVTIDPEAEVSSDTGSRRRSRLQRLPVSNIEPGVFVLLRTGGGGDYIVPVADKFLGQHKESARASQQKWKSFLQDKVITHGALKTSIELLDMGSIRAEENNLRTWMSSGNIGPEDVRDFEAIMRLIGLADQAAEYWSNAELIRSAHKKAGFHIRRLLLKIVDGSDLSPLERTGRMEFELPGTGAGSFTAFRVRAVSPNQYKVPAFRLAEPFELRELFDQAGA